MPTLISRQWSRCQRKIARRISHDHQTSEQPVFMAANNTLADALPPSVGRKLERPAQYQVQTQPRTRPAHVKEPIVVAREYKNIRLRSEDVAEFRYQPTGDLVSNGAYMVMAALAWSLKAWLAWNLQVLPGRWRERHEKPKQQRLRVEFKGFVNACIRLPCQIIPTGRQIVYRLLGWSPGLNVFLRAVDSLRSPIRC